MTSQTRPVSCPTRRLVVLAALLSAAARPAAAQLRMSVWQAESGTVYQVLQYRAGEGGGLGIDLNGGCLYETHRNLAEQMAVLQYGF